MAYTVNICNGDRAVRIILESAYAISTSTRALVIASRTEIVSLVTDARSIISLKTTVIAVLMLLSSDWLPGMVEIIIGGAKSSLGGGDVLPQFADIRVTRIKTMIMGYESFMIILIVEPPPAGAGGSL